MCCTRCRWCALAARRRALPLTAVVCRRVQTFDEPVGELPPLPDATSVDDDMTRFF